MFFGFDHLLYDDHGSLVLANEVEHPWYAESLLMRAIPWQKGFSFQAAERGFTARQVRRNVLNRVLPCRNSSDRKGVHRFV